MAPTAPNGGGNLQAFWSAFGAVCWQPIGLMGPI